METLLLTRSDIAATLDMQDCIEAVESAFRSLGRGESEPPQTMGVHVANGGFHVKAGILRFGDRQFFACKTNGNFPANPGARGLPTIQGLVVLCDADDGRVLAAMDSLELTARRTAAATAVAARHLARKQSATLAVIGCGTQGSTHIEAMRAVLPLERIVVFDTNAARAAQLTNEFNDRIRIESANSIGAATAAADAIVTCTTSYEFILNERDVRPGTFVAGVGVDNESKKELHPALLGSSKVVTDLTAQCAGIGDLHHAIDAEAMGANGVHAELAAVVAGMRPGRENEDEIIVFDSTGLAIQDVAAAVIVYETAVKAGRVRRLAFTD